MSLDPSSNKPSPEQLAIQSTLRSLLEKRNEIASLERHTHHLSCTSARDCIIGDTIDTPEQDILYRFYNSIHSNHQSIHSLYKNLLDLLDRTLRDFKHLHNIDT